MDGGDRCPSQASEAATIATALATTGRRHRVPVIAGPLLAYSAGCPEALSAFVTGSQSQTPHVAVDNHARPGRATRKLRLSSPAPARFDLYRGPAARSCFLVEPIELPQRRGERRIDTPQRPLGSGAAGGAYPAPVAPAERCSAQRAGTRYRLLDRGAGHHRANASSIRAFCSSRSAAPNSAAFALSSFSAAAHAR